MTYGTTEGKQWVEALPTKDGASFTGRTFSRFHIVGDGSVTPTIGEIWATSQHAVQSHAHDSDELLYVLGGEIEVNGRTLRKNDVVLIPRGTPYAARVLAAEGSHVLRVELPHASSRAEGQEYEARIWEGPVTADGFPDLGADSAG